MSTEAERLVVEPFNEILNKAKTALENAEESDTESSAAMAQAARNLAREAERALKKIEPLCTKSLDQHGSRFVDAIKDNSDITNFREELNDLLWDFEDYITPEEFSQEKFEELQKCSRQAAPKIVDILKRMKLMVPVPTPAHVLLPNRVPAPIPSPSTSHPSVASAFDEGTRSGTRGPSHEDINLTSKPPFTDDGELPRPMGTLAGPDEGLGDVSYRLQSSPLGIINGLRRSGSQRSGVSDGSAMPPQPPVEDPWRIGRWPFLGSENHSQDEFRVERRPPVDQAASVSLDDLAIRPFDSLPTGEPQFRQDVSNWRRQILSHRSRPESAAMEPMSPTSAHSSITDSSASGSASARLSRATSANTYTIASPVIPEESAVCSQSGSITNSSPSMATIKPRSLTLPIRQPSAESVGNSTILDGVRNEYSWNPVPGSVRSSTAFTEPNSPYSAVTQLPRYSGPPIYHSRVPTNSSFATETTTGNPSSTTTSASVQRSGSDVPRARAPQPGDDEGMIPVESEAPESQPMPLRQPDCSIGARSSFYQMKGFCKGAEEERAKPETGFKKIKRPAGWLTLPQGFSMVLVAKCNHCLFEQDWKSIEKDLRNDANGNYMTHDVNFRLRVLQKSHLPIRHIEEQLYACVFCIQSGKTNDESDATVFFTQNQLFLHLARHPRPLPAVPGLVVVEGPDVPPTFRDRFDLHFPQPPKLSPMPGIAREIGKLPTGVAKETKKNMHGIMRSPPDRAAVLQYAVGARIVGLEYPAKYDGKWAIGWHDGVRAAFEADTVQLEAPSPSEIRMQGTSNTHAIARWRWKQTGGESNWLRFEKGEVIKNISWAYADHWCWSGTSSKGCGIFPASHLDHKLIRTIPPGDSTSMNSVEKKMKALSRLVNLHKSNHNEIVPRHM